MASQGDRNAEREREGLKYLGFFHAVALQMLSGMESIYSYGKGNCGPLKNGIDAVEVTVKTFVSPVYRVIKDKPYQVLWYADRKMDESISNLEKKVPETVKTATKNAFQVTKRAYQGTMSFITGIRGVGVVETSKGVAREAYSIAESVAEQWAILGWYMLLKVPMLPKVIEIMLPPTVQGLHIYNAGVHYLADSHYKVGSFLHPVPVETVEKTIYGSLSASKGE